MESKLLVTSIDTFNGQVSDVDPGADTKGGMLQQVNMLSEVTGTLTTRGGLKRLELDELE